MSCLVIRAWTRVPYSAEVNLVKSPDSIAVQAKLGLVPTAAGRRLAWSMAIWRERASTFVKQPVEMERKYYILYFRPIALVSSKSTPNPSLKESDPFSCVLIAESCRGHYLSPHGRDRNALL